MDITALERIDSFPYRHRVAELMSAPIVALAPSAAVGEAVATMLARRISSVMVLDVDGRARGIFTERDVLRCAAADIGGLGVTLEAAMTAPVHVVAHDALAYTAMARLARLGVRHLPVVDELGRVIGMLTSGGLLKQRASLALPLGDEIETATDAASLAAVHRRLPALAAGLRREDVPAPQIAAAVAAITRDLTARAAALALEEMRAAGSGAPPANWCLLVLGSAGRGETLLAPDQDNALVHDGDKDADAWFAAFAARVNRILDDAGVSYCKGGVMARNPAFRHSLDGWVATIDGWIAHPRGQALLDVDIFYDFVAVAGDGALASALRTHATRAASSSRPFLMLLAAGHPNSGAALGLLGRFRTRQGRFDLKLQGLLPIVAGARAVALAWSLEERGTDARLAAAAAAGALVAEDAEALTAARAVLVEAILDQQLVDIAAGRAPGSLVEPGRLTRPARERLRAALRTAATAASVARDALSERPGPGAS